MTVRAQLDHLLLDVDFIHKPSIKAFRRDFGWLSVLWLIEVYCQMSRATNGLVKESVLLAVAEEIGIDESEVRDAIEYAADPDNELITRIDGRYTNSRVRKDQEAFAKKKAARKAAADKWRAKDNPEIPKIPLEDIPEISQETNRRYQKDISSDTDTVSDTDIYINKGQPETRDEKTYHYYGEHVRLSRIAYEQLCVSNRKEVVDKALDIVEGQVSSKRDNPNEYPRLCREARNADGILRKWALTEARAQLSKLQRAEGFTPQETKQALQPAKVPGPKPLTGSEAAEKFYEIAIQHKGDEAATLKALPSEIAFVAKRVGLSRLMSSDIAEASKAEGEFIKIFSTTKREVA